MALNRDPNSLPCNCCGECCIRGGACIFREWDQWHLPKADRRPLAFTGRCELLESQADGSTVCLMMLKVPAVNFRTFVNGKCDFPDIRRELVQIGLPKG